MSGPTLPAIAFKNPAVALSGLVDYSMYVSFRQQFDAASSQNLVVIELSTLGGDPEVARMMGEDVRFASETEPQRRFVFLGKAAIYSAGTTFMSFFVRENRYLARGTRLMIHERKLSRQLVVDGPLTTCLATVQATLNEIECSIERGISKSHRRIQRHPRRGDQTRAVELVPRGAGSEEFGADRSGVVRRPSL